MAINFPEGTQNYPGGKLIDYDYRQSGTHESFSVGNSDYIRDGNYRLTVNVANANDIIFLSARMSWSSNDGDEEVGFSWYYRSGTSGSWTRVTQSNATGDVLNGREGTTTGTHNNNFNAMTGSQVGVMDVWLTIGGTGTFQFAPGVSGNGSTNSTMHINRFGSNSSSSNWDIQTSSMTSCFVYEA